MRLHTDERLQSAGFADLLLALAGEPRDVERTLTKARSNGGGVVIREEGHVVGGNNRVDDPAVFIVSACPSSRLAI